MLKWEGATYTYEASDKSIGLPFRCDGCEQMIHAAEIYVGTVDTNGNRIKARWCRECVKVVESSQ